MKIKKLIGKRWRLVSLIFKRAHVTIKHISCVKNFWQRHNPTILTSSSKEMVKNILDGNKESEISNRSEVVERCESQRSPEHVITEPSVSENVKSTEEKTERVSEFNVNSNFKGHFEVDKEETAVISTMKLLSDIGSSVGTMSVLTNSNVSKDGFFRRNIIKKEHNIQLAGDWKSNILHGKAFRQMDQNFLNTAISILEENINHFCCFVFKANKIKKKEVAKVTFPFGLELLNAILGTASAKENYQ